MRKSLPPSVRYAPLWVRFLIYLRRRHRVAVRARHGVYLRDLHGV